MPRTLANLEDLDKSLKKRYDLNSEKTRLPGSYTLNNDDNEINDDICYKNSKEFIKEVTNSPWLDEDLLYMSTDKS